MTFERLKLEVYSILRRLYNLENEECCTARDTSFVPSGIISSTNVQAALEELAGDITSIGTLPTGGDAGQVLSKIDGTDFNTEWVDPSGGSVDIVDITYADMATAIAGSTLTKGQFYRITDATGSDLGIIVQAIRDNQISIGGSGGFLNADYQNVGDYSGVFAETGVTPISNIGIWRLSFEEIIVSYTNLAGGNFAVGDSITGGTTGATAQITYDDGVSQLVVYMTSPGIAFDGSEVLDNGSGVTADMNGAASAPTIQTGDIVIFNNLHWQCIDNTQLNGVAPESNVLAYVQISKTATTGYIQEWDSVEYDFVNTSVTYRGDKRGNRILGNGGQDGFQWGSDQCSQNLVFNGFLTNRNFKGGTNGNTVYRDATIEVGNNTDSGMNNNTLFAGASLTGSITYGIIENNFFSQNSQVEIEFSDGGLVNNKFGNASTFECSGSSGIYVENNILENAASVSELNLGSSAVFSNNYLYLNSSISTLDIGESGTFSNNLLGNGSLLSSIDIGASATMSNNNFAAGSTFGIITVDTGILVDGNVNSVSITFGNKTFDANFTENILNIESSVSETVSTAITKKIAQSGISNFEETVDITGLTTLTISAEYNGIINVESSNATETIDTITNFPILFPFIIKPVPGLVLTVTGTAIGSAVAGSIVLTTANIVLDGDKQEYLDLQPDPTNTFVIEKSRVVGII